MAFTNRSGHERASERTRTFSTLSSTFAVLVRALHTAFRKGWKRHSVSKDALDPKSSSMAARSRKRCQWRLDSLKQMEISTHDLSCERFLEKTGEFVPNVHDTRQYDPGRRCFPECTDLQGSEGSKCSGTDDDAISQYIP